MKTRDKNDRNKFNIDLLKGHGIPPKSGPTRIIITIITVMVPSLIAMLLFILYQNNEVITKITQQDMIKLQDKTAELSDDVKMQKKLEREAVFYKACLSEVKTNIGKYYQWSPVLVTLVNEMPASVVLTELEVDKEKIKKQIPKTDQSGSMNTIDMDVTKMVVNVSNKGQGDYVEEIKDFRDRLYSSSVIGSKLENISFSRRTEDEGGRENVSYQIKCLFKPEL